MRRGGLLDLEGMEGILPCAVVVQLGPQGFVCGLTKAVRGEVEGDGQVLVLLNGGTEPLLAVLGEIVVGQEGHGQGEVRFWWCEVAVEEGFVDDVESSAAAGFFKVGGHTPDGVDFKVRVTAAS